ncbi:hypothetical protein ARTHROSP310_36360 [Arthrobacter sp. AD-310]
MPDGEPDPGEVVWTWVPYQEDHGRGKDRPRQGRPSEARLDRILHIRPQVIRREGAVLDRKVFERVAAGRSDTAGHSRRKWPTGPLTC